MKKNIKNNKKKVIKKQHYWFYTMLSFIMFILSTIICVNIIKNNLFKIFHIILIILILIVIVFILSFIINLKKLRKCIKDFFAFISIVFIIIEVIFLVYGVKSLQFLSNITDTGYRVETYDIYVLNDSSYKDLNDLNNKEIYYLDSNDTTINDALNKIDKKIEYETKGITTIDELVNKLINQECDAIIFSDSYASVIEEDFNEEYSNLKMIDDIDIVEYIKTSTSNKDITKDNFVVYISGIDSSGNILSKSRSDVNLLLLVNPNTNKILLINTPRDYYVYLPEYNAYDKLTHAGLYGIDESMEALENLYDIDIDYYVRINFTSFIKIVDAIGGIEVDVSSSFCEQDSNRSFASKDLICLNEGIQTLNGEQALAYARTRHTLATGDRARGENQMKILSAIINKASSPSIIKNYNKILSALDGKMITNLDSSTIYRFVKNQIKEKSSYEISSISASGINAREVCFSTGKGTYYVMKKDNDKINEIKEKINEIFDTTE